MTEVPTLTPALDGILSVGGQPVAGAGPVHLLAPVVDGSERIISIDPQGNTTYVPAGVDSPYTQFWISKDGQKASCMPLRSGGPLPGARWRHYGLVVVPTTGL